MALTRDYVSATRHVAAAQLAKPPKWLLALLLWTAGCTSLVKPPTDVDRPVEVLLIRDARHRGLLLPNECGYVEFGFGEWDWYALGNDAWYHVFPALLWPTKGTLCRRQHHAYSLDAVRAALSWAEFEPFVVEHDAAEALRNKLEATFAARVGERVQQPYTGLDFVPDDNSYWLFDNCADACAVWLRELGCTVSWVPIRIDIAGRR